MGNRRHAVFAGTAVAVLALAAAGCGGGDSYQGGQGGGKAAPAGGSSSVAPGDDDGYGSAAPKAGTGAGTDTDTGAGADTGAGTGAAAKALGVRSVPGLGKVLTDGKGRTLYRFDKDSAWPMRFGCTGACLDTWKPAKPADKSKLDAAVPAKLISTVTRPDGAEQLAVDCWPVYWFTGDKKAGDANGQGKMGLWFAVSGAGKKVTASAAEAGPATGY
ncbi:hypothetical protein [Streptomyces varsoviensis]|uniref:hypothetical protein n=1 Tax=Streptomyces varsoviensis TaxID=67373 RepID=UPI000998D8A2|nr:hypothetical protein [Streptomyces varsoviensis]